MAYPNNTNHTADYVCVLFIFIYTFGYSIGFGPAAWVYGSEVCTKLQSKFFLSTFIGRESLQCRFTNLNSTLLIPYQIFPTNFRARGLNLAASGSSIGSIISSQIWPIGMNSIGSKTHFIFMSTNLVSAIIICTSRWSSLSIRTRSTH
jgi:hypothetical protein